MAFTHDLNGNLTTYKTNTLTWDAESRINSFGAILTAGYRADGLRAWKQTSAGRIFYRYDGDKPVLEEDNAGAETAIATYGTRRLPRFNCKVYSHTLLNYPLIPYRRHIPNRNRDHKCAEL